MSVVIKLAVEGSTSSQKDNSESTSSLNSESQTKRRKTQHHSIMLPDNSSPTDSQPLIELSGVWFKMLQ